jgi:hypothetical protein
MDMDKDMNLDMKMDKNMKFVDLFSPNLRIFIRFVVLIYEFSK